MTPATVSTAATVTAAVAILGFLWSLHTDMADIRDRMAAWRVRSRY